MNHPARPIGLVPRMLSRHPHPNAVPTIGPFEYRFTPSVKSIRLARHVLAGWLCMQPGVDEDGLDDLLVVCSELCTNAITHASGAVGSVAVRASVHEHAIVLEVEDDGPGFEWPAVRVIGDVLAEAEHGRGLFIVEALTDRLTVHRTEGRRTVVRARKDGMVDHARGPRTSDLSAGFRREAWSQ